jgi:hypothetical protein
MRGDVLVSSVRLCEIYIALKYTQLAATDKKATVTETKLFGKTIVKWLVIATHDNPSRSSRDNSALMG